MQHFLLRQKAIRNAKARRDRQRQKFFYDKAVLIQKTYAVFDLDGEDIYRERRKSI
jgi:hypothetical protein